MVGLRCAEVSPLAWQALAHVVDAAIAIRDEAATDALDRLRHPIAGDPAIAAGASGAAGVAALLAVMHDSAPGKLRRALGLGSDTRVFAIVTEGT